VSLFFILLSAFSCYPASVDLRLLGALGIWYFFDVFSFKMMTVQWSGFSYALISNSLIIIIFSYLASYHSSRRKYVISIRNIVIFS